MSPEDRNRKFLNKLEEREVNVQACYQCGRCSAGCPVGEFFDLNVMEVVRLAAYGMEEPLLNCHTIWLCAACETCATRCPNDIEIAGLMDVLREIALRKKSLRLNREFLFFIRHSWVQSAIGGELMR